MFSKDRNLEGSKKSLKLNAISTSRPMIMLDQPMNFEVSFVKFIYKLLQNKRFKTTWSHVLMKYTAHLVKSYPGFSWKDWMLQGAVSNFIMMFFLTKPTIDII